MKTTTWNFDDLKNQKAVHFGDVRPGGASEGDIEATKARLVAKVRDAVKDMPEFAGQEIKSDTRYDARTLTWQVIAYVVTPIPEVEP